jgi:hypothetical protein
LPKLFPDTIPYTRQHDGLTKLPVLSHPMNPDVEGYSRNQLHRDLCETTGLVHTHNAMCFKHIPRSIHAFIDSDKDCRFHLPRPTVECMHFDGDLNGHNPTVTLALGCNTDLKQMASGSVAMATIEYMCNYTTKLQLDTAIVFSALCATIRALQVGPPLDVTGAIDAGEWSRLLMIKVTNSLVGKRELTGQETASLLLGRENRYVSDMFKNYWWSSMLRDIAREVFAPAVLSEVLDLQDSMHEESGRMVIPPDEDDSLIFLSSTNLSTKSENLQDQSSPKQYSQLFEDIFYCPASLQDKSVWYIMRNYLKVKLPRSDKQRKTYLRFLPGHSQYSSYCLKEVDKPIIPVLMGYCVPRNDCDADKDKYAVVILTLFKPWSSSKDSPLKETATTWSESLAEFLPCLTEDQKSVIANLQLLYQTKDAKFDYQAARLARLRQLNLISGNDGGFTNDDGNGIVDDPVCENAMQAELTAEDVELIALSLSTSNKQAVEVGDIARRVGFYSCTDIVPVLCAGTVVVASDSSKVEAERRNATLRLEKDARIKALKRLAEGPGLQRAFSRTNRIPEAFNTTLFEESEKACLIYEYCVQRKA